MRYLHSTLWLLFAAAWLAAFFVLASMVGGAQWLAHTGQGVPATMNILLAALCLAVAVCVSFRSKAKRLILFAALAVALVHLFNGLGSYLLVTLSNNRISVPPALMLPFYLVGSVIPTNPIFAKGLVGNWQLVALPLANAVLALLSLLSPNAKGKRQSGDA